MHTKPKTIILFYEENEQVLSMQQLLQHLTVPVEVIGVEKFQHLLEMIGKKPPDMIIFYAANSAGSIDYLKSLRINTGGDEIPVYVFSKLPEPQTLMDLLERT
jgi:hypothetical protein